MSSDSSGAPGPKESKEHKDKGIKKFWKKLTNQTNGSQMEEEVMSILEAGQESGVLKEEGKKMINSIFALDDKLAYEIMTPRTDVFVIDIEDPPEEYVDDLMKLRYSRIPVCQGETDNIIGILNIKDYLIQAWEKGFESVDIASILRAPYFVPETKNIDALLFELQKMKQQIAILIDEYGGFSGIVTMEDIIEQVVGDIDDEYDEEVEIIDKVDDHIYLVDGDVSLEDLDEELGIDLTSETSETSAAFSSICWAKSRTRTMSAGLLSLKTISSRSWRSRIGVSNVSKSIFSILRSGRRRTAKTAPLPKTQEHKCAYERACA